MTKTFCRRKDSPGLVVSHALAPPASQQPVGAPSPPTRPEREAAGAETAAMRGPAPDGTGTGPRGAIPQACKDSGVNGVHGRGDSVECSNLNLTTRKISGCDGQDEMRDTP